ncbi:BamA/TamA family outer membrane protein [Novosphingobium sp. PC22D]|uniref:autotransporter assembly complex protein TamA n=1 Tax=Novosphingobium sp. PC22D TaxID=1962403 RepID=UPI000BF02DB4|nr:BamA/TamA family outer membrane protein [Novosphingobium sp. PC22D]
MALALAASPALAQDATDEPGEAGAQSATAESEDLRAGDIPVPTAPETLPEVEPIITDSEFNETVPALAPEDDAELRQPLESIDAFERRLAAEAADDADAEPDEGGEEPLGEPALADGDTTEEIGDAPVRDAELTAPLPPLDSFEVTPVEFAESEADPADVKVSYKTRIEGLESADEETETDLEGQFKDLSALRDGDGEAANVAMVSARLTEDSALIKSILASEGWFSPAVTTRIDPAENEEDPSLRAVISVNPGTRYTFSDIVIEADPTEPPDLISKNFAIEVGEPIVAERVQGAEAKLSVVLPENGYPFAEVKQRDILLDPDTGDGVYTLPVSVGPRSRFDGFSTDGDLAFDAEHVEVLARFERGELYDSRKVDDLRKALIATGLLSTVSVEPKRTGEAVGDGTEYVRIDVQQQAGPPRTIAGSAGYAAGEGITLKGTWTHRNMFPPEGALIVDGIAGTQQQGAGVTFRRSNAGKRDRTFELSAEALRANYDAFDAYTGRLAARISRDSTPLWQKRITYAYGVQLIGTAERSYDFEAGRKNRRTYYIGGLTGQLGLDTSDDLLNPTKGFRVTALVEPEGSLEDGFSPYVRARLDASAYYPVGDSFVLAGRVRFGTIQGADLFDIAPSRRFYAGGGGSVRGFGYQKLGPLDPEGDPIGGRSLNEAAAEVRYRFGNFGIVGFVDVGQSYAETTPQFSDLRYGVGLGGRFYTNFGPMRLDVATPIDRRPGEAWINVYVSIGQAF